jgi:hypothetical protein
MMSPGLGHAPGSSLGHGNKQYRLTGSSVLPVDQRVQLMQACNADPQVKALRQWLNDAPGIMTSTGKGPILSYQLPNSETISCVQWKGQFYITGTDIVKILKFRFARMKRLPGNPKKFEEGIFSDLRNLKAGEHATLEEPRSEFLEFLYKHNCIRTQKKQKVFYWFEVRHDDLVCEAFERDAKRQNTQSTISSFIQAQQRSQFPYAPQLAAGMYVPQAGRLPLTPQQAYAGRLMPKGLVPYYDSPIPTQQDLFIQQQAQPQQPAYQTAFERDVDAFIGTDYFDTTALQDNILQLAAAEEGGLFEPAPKSPRLSQMPTPCYAPSPLQPAATPVLAAQPSPIKHNSVDPSLLSALPAKAQRKLQQLTTASSHGAVMGASEPPSDPLLNEIGGVDDMFGYDASAALGFTSFDQDYLDFAVGGDTASAAEDFLNF